LTIAQHECKCRCEQLCRGWYENARYFLY